MQTEEGTSGSTRMALRNLRDLLARTKADLMADAPLLEQYTARRDEEAFAALLRRHGPMVLSLCRRLLHHEQDAEDAFQATFLLLAAKASAVRKRSSIASWLYGVAYRVAFRLRARDAARRRRERITIDRIGPAIEAEPTWREMTVALDEELAALSEDRRAPLLLCYIEGLTQEAAAHRLGWSHATFRRRLRAGLTLLRSRLAGRGLALPAGLLAVGLTRNAAEAALTTPLIDATARAAGSGAAGAVPDRVAVIVAEALRAMLVNHLKTLGVLLLTATVLVAGAGLLVRATWAGGAAPSVTVVDPEPTPKAPESDLPPGAVARMGTPGLRQVGSFYCLAFAPDGKMLAIAQMDSTIRLVEVATAREVRRLGTPAPADTRSRNYWVSALCFSPDGRRLASLQPGKGVTVWDAVAGKSLCQVATDLSYEPCSLAFAPDGKTLLTGGADGVARLWDSTTGTKGLALKGHDGRCLAVAFAPDGKRVATGGADESVRLWDPSTGQQLRALIGHRNEVHAVAFTADGTTIASASTDDTLRLWNVKTGAEQRRLDAALSASASGVISSLTFLDAGRTVALGRSDRVASFWDVATGRELPRFEGRRAEPTNLAISPDGKYVALGNVPFGTPARPGGVSRAIHLWERATGAEAARSVGHTLPASSLVYSPDGTTLVSGSADGSARVWDAATGRHLRTFSGHVGPISCVAFGSGGRTIATASSSPRDRAISLWSVANGAEVRRLPLTAKRGGQQVKPGYPAGVIAMAFAPAGDGLATVVTDGSIRLWDATDGSVRADVRSGGLGVAFTRDGAHLLCGGADGLVRLLDARTGAVARVLKLATPPDATASPIPPRGANPDVGFRTRVTALTLTPDGTAFLAVTTDGSLRMWEIATGRYVSQIVLPGARGRAVRTEMSTALYGRSGAAFAPDARAVAVRGRDGMLYLVEMATGQPRCRLGDGSATVTALAFSPDGRTVAAAQSDSTLVVWDVNGAERPKTRLLDRELEEAWAGLGAAEAARAYRALCALANAPQSSVPYLGRVLRPAPPPDAKRLAGLIADLASESYPVRRKATEALELMGEPARGALTKALAAGPALEVTRRIEAILRGIDAGRLTPEQLRELRAIEALERIGSPAARNVLEQMAAGTDGLRITAEARASLRRLAGRGKGVR